MVVTEGPGGIRTKAISNRYPATKGRTAGSTYQKGTIMNLQYQKGSMVMKRERKGFD